MKTVAIIQARLTSTRFPNKILEKIDGKTMLQYVIDNVLRGTRITQVIVAIPKGQDIPFRNAFKYEGSENNVLERYYMCAQKYQADTVVRITSDCPMITPYIIDIAIDTYSKINLPYLVFAPICGSDVEVFSFRLLQEAHLYATDPYDREHVTPYMKRKTKLSVDTPADLVKVKKFLKERTL